MTTPSDIEAGWRRLSGDSHRDLSGISQDRAREIALWLWERNGLANRLVELPTAYLTAEGVRLECDDPEGQRMLDSFWHHPLNRMTERIEHMARELSLFGELLLPVAIDPAGRVRISSIDPTQIAQVLSDPDDISTIVGVETRTADAMVTRRWRTVIRGPEDLFGRDAQAIRAIATGDLFYLTVNRLSCGRRGRPDLLASADFLDGYDQFLFGEMDRAALTRAFVWDVTLRGATEDQIRARAAQIASPRPGSANVHNDSEVWSALAPPLNAVDQAEQARLLRNHILGSGTVPEHWFGGASDVNRATGQEMTEPTHKVMTARQQVLCRALEDIGTLVLDAWQDPTLTRRPYPDQRRPDLHVRAVFPELSARDTTRWATALTQVAAATQVLLGAGVLSRQTALKLVAAIAARLDVAIDTPAELERAAADAATAAQADYPAPGQPADDPAPGQPTDDPAPGQPADDLMDPVP